MQSRGRKTCGNVMGFSFDSVRRSSTRFKIRERIEDVGRWKACGARVCVVRHDQLLH